MFVRAHQLETQGVAVPACTCLPKKMTLSSVASCRICRRRREARSYEADKGRLSARASAVSLRSFGRIDTIEHHLLTLDRLMWTTSQLYNGRA